MQNPTHFHPLPGPVPLHVGIIPDGGRRWAEAGGCTLREAYSLTRSKLESFVTFLIGMGVREISIYLSSIQNLVRDQDEVSANLDLVEASLTGVIAALAKQHNLRIIIAGNREILQESLLKAILTVERMTVDNTAGRLNLLIAYDPLEEIVQAVKSSKDPGYFFEHLKVTTPIDLIIRSGGAPLLSNFLPLQSGYARLSFFQKLFNDLTISDLEEVLLKFTTIDRKFGE